MGFRGWGVDPKPQTLNPKPLESWAWDAEFTIQGVAGTLAGCAAQSFGSLSWPDLCAPSHAPQPLNSAGNSDKSHN